MLVRAGEQTIRHHRREAPEFDDIRFLKKASAYIVGGCVWIYNTPAIIRQGVKSGTDAILLKGKLCLSWTGLPNMLAVGPSPSRLTPEGHPLADKLLYLDVLNDMPGPHAPCRASIFHYKPCSNQHDTRELARYVFEPG